MLFSSIKDEKTLYQSPDPLRNPLIFYLGHTAAFYINKFKLAGYLERGIDEKLDHLFAVGVDPESPDDLNSSQFWPDVNTVQDYKRRIYNVVHEIIDQLNFQIHSIDQDNPMWALLMAFEHDRIHFETSSVLIRQLDHNLLSSPNEWDYAPSFGNPIPNEWIKVYGGEVFIGKDRNKSPFGWDNEYGGLRQNVKAFQATQNLISNSEYMEFVLDGAYENPHFWSIEGWKWKLKTNSTHPRFWLPIDGKFLYRAMFDILEMPMDWPVEVNAHEAEAYCKWKGDGCRLMKEAEFVFISREGLSTEDDPVYSDLYNLNFSFGSPTPVGHMREGKSASGFHDLWGNVWEWLADDFYPLPGFKTHHLYEDFSLPFMDSDHGMMAGGSWITTGTGASKYYRLWFRRHFYQHAGFRMAKSCS